MMQGLNKKPLTTEEALALPGLHDEATKYAVLHLIEMLSPIRELRNCLTISVWMKLRVFWVARRLPIKHAPLLQK
jgi:hypothetical protein